MTDNTQPEALRLALSIDLMDTFTNYQQEELNKAAAELRRQHARIAELEARIKTMAEEHADELMVAHMDGRMRGHSTEPTGEYPALPDADRDYMRKVVAVAVTMLFDSYKEDVMRVFSTGELSEFVTITAAMGGEQVEDIYRRAWDLLSLSARASHGQAPAGLAVPSMSADEVNALPAAARAYIHQLATNTDPAGMVRENMQLRDTNAGLQSMYRKAADAAQEVIGCFHAAECEGLQAALAGTADEHLKDLVERRLMHALYAAQEVAGQAPAQAAPAAIDAARAAQDGGDVAMTTTQGAPTQAADSVLEDAERYRWLRINAIGAFRTNNGNGPVSVYHLSKIPAIPGIPEETDAAIDAARKQGANHD